MSAEAKYLQNIIVKRDDVRETEIDLFSPNLFVKPLFEMTYDFYLMIFKTAKEKNITLESRNATRFPAFIEDLYLLERFLQYGGILKSYRDYISDWNAAEKLCRGVNYISQEYSHVIPTDIMRIIRNYAYKYFLEHLPHFSYSTLGTYATATGHSTIAIGNSAVAYPPTNFAWGYDNVVIGNSTTTIGPTWPFTRFY